MKTLKFTLLSLVLLLTASILQAQTADEIISKCIDATGGKEKISQINSMYMENSMEVMGNESLSKITILNGKGIKTISDVMGQSMIQCYTDKSGWMINPMGGSSDPAPMSDEQYKAGKSSIYIGESFVDYATKGNKVELLGKEKVNNVDAFKLKVTTKDSVSSVYYIDPATYYIIQTTLVANMMGQQMEIISTMHDYKKTDFGYVLPYSYEINYGGQFSLTMKLKKVEFNQPVDPKIFELGNKD
jgi:outer membrane lipoprotein-sorting protein